MIDLNIAVKGHSVRFSLDVGSPVNIYSPFYLEVETFRDIGRSIKRQIKHQRVGYINGLKFLNTFNPSNYRRIGSILRPEKISLGLPFVMEELKTCMNGPPYGLGNTERILLEMALFAKEKSLILFSTTTCDPKGRLTIQAYANILSKNCYMIHIEHSSSQLQKLPPEWSVAFLRVFN